jgi:hypothetical protein
LGRWRSGRLPTRIVMVVVVVVMVVVVTFA